MSTVINMYIFLLLQNQTKHGGLRCTSYYYNEQLYIWSRHLKLLRN